MKHNRIIAVILLIFIGWWAYLTTQLPETTMPGEPGPKFFPAVILGLMAVFSVLLFFTKDKKDTAMVKTDETDDTDDAEDAEKEVEKKEEVFPIFSALKLFAVFFVGIVLVYFLGFNIGMIFGLTVMLWMIGWRLFPRAILFSAAVTLAVYFLFDWLLKIPLPKGSLF
ncbi:MAG TPA: tripartite tricarboxylate transporter TctB family protein [Peptococcaceae bacterium]|nr:tripartite tricarboxylate transporter TctB family protein [Peptococcaceae bacterium]